MTATVLKLDEAAASMTFADGLAFIERTRRQLDRFGELPARKASPSIPRKKPTSDACATNWRRTSRPSCRTSSAPSQGGDEYFHFYAQSPKACRVAPGQDELG
jgi:hypothetical protein